MKRAAGGNKEKPALIRRNGNPFHPRLGGGNLLLARCQTYGH
jgi:hypothetical protein